MKRFVLSVSVVAITTIVGSANAQLWLRDRNSQGTGFHTGGAEIHPSFGAEIGYDSNYFNRPKNDANYPVVDTVKLRFTPSISMRTDRAPTLPTMTWSLDAGLIYTEFLTNTDKLGRNREVGVVGDGRVNFLPGRPIGFSIYDTVVRTTQPALDVEPTAGLNRIDNKVGGELIYTRKGGLFDWKLGYAFGITRFEADFAQQLDNDQHTVYTSGRFRFLPKTALVYNGSIGFINYKDAPAGLSNSDTVRTNVGLSGLLTDRLSLLAMIGWGAAFYDNAIGSGTRDFDSVIGQVELKYFLTSGEQAEAGAPVSNVSVGYTRNFQNSYLGNYYQQDRGYVGVSAVFVERFYLGLNAGLSRVMYADVLGRSGTLLVNSFSSGRIDAALLAEYRLTNWLGVNGTFQYLNDTADVRIPFNSTDATRGSFGIGFQRYQVLGGVRAFY